MLRAKRCKCNPRIWQQKCAFISYVLFVHFLNVSSGVCGVKYHNMMVCVSSLCIDVILYKTIIPIGYVLSSAYQNKG